MAAFAWTKARRGRYTEVFSNQTHTRKWNLELALSVAFVKVVGMTASRGGGAMQAPCEAGNYMNKPVDELARAAAQTQSHKHVDWQ